MIFGASEGHLDILETNSGGYESVPILYNDSAYELPLFLKKRENSCEEPAFLYIDCQRRTTWMASDDPFEYDTTNAILNGRTIVFPVSSFLSGEDICKFFRNTTALNLIKQIVDAREIILLDGKKLVGKCVAGARFLRVQLEASEELQRILDSIETKAKTAQYAEIYFQHIKAQDLLVKGELFDVAARRLYIRAMDTGVHIIGGVTGIYKFLIEKKESLGANYEL